MNGEYFTMPRRVTSSDGDGRLDILLSLRIGGGACPAGGVGDFTTCLLLGACSYLALFLDQDFSFRCT